MPLPISRSALDALGKRLARGTATAADRETLLAILNAYDAALTIASAALAEAGFSMTTRLKSRDTLLDKLRGGTSFKTVRDIAGVRLQPCSDRVEQDTIVG